MSLNSAVPQLRQIVWTPELRTMLGLHQPSSRILHWVAAGVYYGYPLHCIEAFLARATVRMTGKGTPVELAYIETDLPEAQPFESSGCIPSEQLLQMTTEAAIALINENRFAPYAFEPDLDNEPPCPDLEELVATNPAYKEAFMNAVNTVYIDVRPTGWVSIGGTKYIIAPQAKD